MGLFDKSGQHFDKSGQPLDADYEHVAPMASESDDLIASVEKIIDKAKRSGMGDALLKDVDEEALHIAEWLKITKRQSMMLSLFLNFSYSDRIEIGEISRYLECSPVRLMRYQADIDELVNRCMLFYDFDRCSYRLSKQLYASLAKKTVFQPFKIDCSSYVEFYETLSKLFECLKNDEFTSEMLSRNIDRLLEGSKNLDFVKNIIAYDLADSKFSPDRTRLLFFCYNFIFRGKRSIKPDDFYDDSFWHGTANILIPKIFQTSVFFRKHILENCNDGGYIAGDKFKFTEDAKNKLFTGIDVFIETQDAGMLSCSKIEKKELFFNVKEKRQLDELSGLIKEENFCKIKERLAQKGMRQGFAALFYGAPGTGKTESVMQLARETERNIQQVSLSGIKSMWVGESEKNIQDVFDRYRHCVRLSRTAPILLFNEADGIFGVRCRSAERAADKSENTIQNIILQEMERLEGIMIATTNLTENLDKAFERRFLYKIKFNAPCIDAKCKIWKSMIPELDDKNAAELSEAYDFTGGQIENIARKMTVNEILSGSKNEPEKDRNCDNASCIMRSIRHLCDYERIEGYGRCKNKFGF